MKLGDLSEAQLVSHFRESFPRGERTIIGIGDVVPRWVLPKDPLL